MSSARIERRPLQIRRRGRHTTPSQVEKVAEKAGKAAPAMAIAGVLVAAPQLPHGSTAKTATVATAERLAPVDITGSPVRPAPVPPAALPSTAVAHAVRAAHARVSHRTYRVRSGDTLSGIAQRFYHKSADWQWLYHENAKKLAGDATIYVGERLNVPYDPPANYTLPYQPRHAVSAPRHTHITSSTSSSSGGTTDGSGSHSGGSLVGTLSCSGLEELWDSAGGAPGDAVMAASIAMAESGGNQYAHSPSDDFGYWQINASNGSLATYDAYGNARAAIILSHDGADWNPWTTYTSGAYAGRC